MNKLLIIILIISVSLIYINRNKIFKSKKMICPTCKECPKDQECPICPEGEVCECPECPICPEGEVCPACEECPEKEECPSEYLNLIISDGEILNPNPIDITIDDWLLITEPSLLRRSNNTFIYSDGNGGSISFNSINDLVRDFSRFIPTIKNIYNEII